MNSQNISRCSLLIGFTLTLATALSGADIPDLSSRWDWRLSGDQLRVYAGPPERRQRLPEHILEEAGRNLVRIEISEEEVGEKYRSGRLMEFVRSHMTRTDEAILWYYTDRMQGAPRYMANELEPILSPEQEAYRKSLAETWLLPLPEGYRAVERVGATIATWKPHWVQQARIRVGQRAMNDGRLIHIEIYRFDRVLSVDEAFLEIGARAYQVRKAFRSSLLYRHEGTDRDMKYPGVWWQSGHFLIHIETPERVHKEVVQAYLEKFPPTWGDGLDADPTRLALVALDEAIPVMEQHVDDPLEFLRYSYRIYPFDDAFRRACRALPGGEWGNALPAHYHDTTVRKIHEVWSQSPPETIVLEEYRAAIIAHRRSLIERLTAARARIHTHGLALTPERRWVYGDDPARSP